MTVETEEAAAEAVPIEYTGNFEADFQEACRKRSFKPFSVLTVHSPLPPLPIPLTPRPQSVSGDNPATDENGDHVPLEGEEKPAETVDRNNVVEVEGPAGKETDEQQSMQDQQTLSPPVMSYRSRFRFTPTMVLETGEGDEEEELQKLEVRGWQISAEMVQILASLIVSCGTFTHLIFWNCGLTSGHITHMVPTLPLTFIRVLSLDQNPLVPGSSFAELMGEDSPVRHLSLRSNNLGDVGAKAIAEQLAVNKTLIGLNLWDNRIGKEGSEALAEALKVNQTLTSLSLGLNNIGDEGANAIAKALSNLPLSHEELASRRKAMADLDKQRKDQEEDPTVGKKSKLRNLTSGGPAAATSGNNRNSSAKMGTRVQSIESLENSPAATSKTPSKPAAAIDPKTKKPVKAGATTAKPEAAAAKAAPVAAPAAVGKTKASDAAAPTAASAKKGASAVTVAEDKTAAKGGKAGVKGAAAVPTKGGKKGKAEEAKEEVDEMPDPTPASEPMFEHQGQWYVLGNRTLTSLNLYGNGIREDGMKNLWEALQEQEATADHAPEGCIGLFRLTLQANPCETASSPLHAQLITYLNGRNPYYENRDAGSETENGGAVGPDGDKVAEAGTVIPEETTA
ncbi:Leucine-rich repeat-containing protein 71 [Thoreauomyces humboldtii]|nr:Leucine-rich repeat-containing protein 71 [Thoreauomyces humboldtii]